MTLLQGSSNGVSSVAKSTGFSLAELPTVGAQLIQLSLGRVRVESWDTPGQDSDRRAVLMHTKGADIIFIIYDITCMESLLQLSDIVRDVIRNGITRVQSACLCVLRNLRLRNTTVGYLLPVRK